MSENTVVAAAVKTDDSEAIEKANMVMDDQKSYSDQMNLLTSYKMTKMETEGSSAWYCLVCGKSWVRKSSCMRHMQTHLVGITLPCTECNKVFGSKNALEVHLRICQRKGQNKTEEKLVEK